MSAPLIKEAEQTSEFRRGWPRLLTAFLSSGLGPIVILNTNGLFVGSITESSGLSASQVQIGTIVSLVLSLSSLLVGLWVGRLGSKRTVIIGFSGMGVLTLSLSILPASPYVFYGVAILMGFFGAMAFQVPFARMISTWFRRRFGLAAGIMGAGGSAMSLVATPIIVATIAAGGWRMGYVVLGSMFLLISLPLVIFGFKERPVEAHFAPESEVAVADAAVAVAPPTGLPLRTVLRNGRFWLVIVGVASASFALVGFVSSFAPAMVDAGYEPAVAALVPMGYLFGGITGRILGGWLLDRLWPYVVPLVVLTIGGIAGLLLASAVDSGVLPLILVLVVFIGIASGADGDFPAFFSREVLGQASLALGVGLMVCLVGIASAVGGIGFAVVKDSVGSYLPAFYVGGAAFIIGGVLIFLAGVGAKRRAPGTLT